MAQANDSVLITAGSGVTIATELIAGKEHQVFVQADNSGHLMGSLPTYLWATPNAVGGAEKLHADLFNAVGSGMIIDIRGIWMIPKLDVAVVGAVAVRVDLYRTSSVGTGGTAAPYKSPTRDVAGGNISPMDTLNAALPAQITARHLPTAGATISEWLIPNYSSTEEASTSTGHMTQFENLIPMLMWGQRLALREGQGILLKQAAVASVGNVGFLVAFTVE